MAGPQMTDTHNPTRVLWFSAHPTPYHNYFFRELADRTLLSFEVIYRTRALATHPWSAVPDLGYRAGYYQTNLGIDWKRAWQALAAKNTFYLMAGWNDPTSFLIITILRLRRRKYAIWTDTPNQSRKRGPIKSFLRQSWLKWIFHGATRLLATGEPGRLALIELGANRQKIDDFPFWVDLKLLRPSEKRKWKTQAPRFVSSGRLSNGLKGHDIALRALASALGDTTIDWRYIIAGTGPDRQLLEDHADKLGIGSRVSFPGWQEPSDLLSIYQTSHILIHPSPVHDPFPNAVLEAMAVGLVVLGSDVSGSVLDRIRHCKNGFVHQAGNWEQLSNQIRELVDSWDEMPKIAEEARRTAEEWPVDRGIEILKKLIGHDTNPN